MNEENNIKKETEFYQDKDKITKIQEKEINYRDFKGIWIPKEIWLNDKLNLIEKCLLAEIDSLDGEDNCYASNLYFSKLFKIKEQNISKYISRLKKLGFIKQIGFDGRKRRLKCTDLMNSLRQTYQKQDVCLNENNYQYNKDNIKDNKELSKDNKITSKEVIKKVKKEFIKKLLSYNNSKDITKYCLDSYFNIYKELHPKANKNTFYSEDKIYECQRLINYYLYGFPKDNYFDLRQFLKLNNISFNLDISFEGNEHKFKKYFNTALNIYKTNYNPTDKQILPCNLLLFLYNRFGKFISYFLFYSSNPPELIKIKMEKEDIDKNPKITQKYIDTFYKNKDIDIKEKNHLISCIKTFVNKHNDIINMSIEYKDKKYLRQDIDNDLFRIHVMDFNFFINEHVEYIERIQNRPFGLEMLSIENGYWDNFCKYYKQTFDVDLDISKKELKDKCMMYVEFNR